MRIRVVAAVLIIAVCPYAAGQNNSASTIKNSPDVALQRVIVTVLDSEGSPVTGLSASNFSTFDGKVPQEIVDFSDADEPLSCGILIDMSVSVLRESFSALDASAKGVLDFIKLSNPANEYFLIGFSHQVRLLADWTNDPHVMIAGLSNLSGLYNRSRQATYLYDGLYEGLSKVKAGSNTKKAILLITDGADTGSRHKLSQLKEMLKGSDCLFYILVLGNALGFESVFHLAWPSGGRDFYFQTPSMWKGKSEDLTIINTILKALALELRHQYSLSYRPSNLTTERKWRRIQVKVKPPGKRKNIVVRHRAGYFSATSNK